MKHKKTKHKDKPVFKSPKHKDKASGSTKKRPREGEGKEARHWAGRA